MCTKLTVNAALAAIIEEGKAADEQMKAWATIKKSCNDKLLEALAPTIKETKESLSGMTTSFELYHPESGGHVATLSSIGYKAELNQTLATALVEANPGVLGVLVRRRWELMATPALKEMNEGTPVGEALQSAVKWKDATVSVSYK